jgi:hypothetical protein
MQALLIQYIPQFCRKYCYIGQEDVDIYEANFATHSGKQP